MKNGKKLGKKIAGGIVKFGEGVREAYTEEYGTKVKKRKDTKKLKPKKRTLKGKGILKITLARPEATVDNKWRVQWSKKGAVSISGKSFSAEISARNYLAKLKKDKKVLGYTIEYTYIRS